MKYYVIGDIHGRLHKLSSVLDKINNGEDGQLVFLGDYVDRGKDSRKVLNKVFDLVENNNAVALLGNHDDMMVQCYKFPGKEESIFWKHHYLKPTNNSYYTMTGWDEILYTEHVNKLSALKKIHQTPTFFFSHSGVPEDPLWGRPKNEDYSVGVAPLYNIHGHTPQSQPFIGDFRANLDTGAAWKDGKLTCGIWEEGSKKVIDIIQND